MTIKEIGQRLLLVPPRPKGGRSELGPTRVGLLSAAHFFHLNFALPDQLWQKKEKQVQKQMKRVKSRVGVNLSTLAKLAEKSSSYVSEQIRT